MSWQNNIRALYVNFIGPSGSVSTHTYDTFPDDDDITLTVHGVANTEGDWVEIISSVGAADVWFVGLYVSNLDIAIDTKVTFGTGASASETQRAVFAFTRTDVTASSGGVVNYGTYYTIPFPIASPTGTREAGRIKSGATAGGADVVEHHAIGLT